MSDKKINEEQPQQEEKKGGEVPKKYVQTPLMKQYYNIKATHPDAILLFRVGDFYEVFGDDAVTASKILGVTLTRRANGAASFVELAGFPYHSLETYLPKLVRAGQRVAICEQLEDPKSVKGLVKRGVVELITPGVVMSDNSLNAKENTFLGAIYFDTQAVGLALLDISTGEYLCTQGDQQYIDKLLANFAPKELLFQRSQQVHYRETIGSKIYSYKLDDWYFSEEPNRERIMRQLGSTSLKGFGIEKMGAAISAAGAILHYLDFTEHRNVSHIRSIGRIDMGDYVWMDRFTHRNLELFATQNSESKHSLCATLDRTHTPMGGRMLRRWVAMPLQNIEVLNQRLEVVDTLVNNIEFQDSVIENISHIGDLERIISRVATGRVTPREVLQLCASLDSTVLLRDLFLGSSNATLRHHGEQLQPLEDLRERIRFSLYPDPATNQVGKGGVIAEGVNAHLDDLRRISQNGKQVLNAIAEREAETSGITSLKIGFNNVFGYYLEVRNTHRDKVPESWIRKQTLTAAERYITAELKEYEEKVIGAEARITTAEQTAWNELLQYIDTFTESVQNNAQIIANVDVLLSFARMAREGSYTRPTLNEGTAIDIVDGRHPVIERLLPVGERYVPNDISLDPNAQQVMIITGPNMSGKSALLRQTALIVLMAQIGSYVPARSATIGVVDKIFTRVGASDNLAQGESTFMVEMIESASILNNITPRSLVLLDEIGRGTSTYDGISISWAMVEYLHNNPATKAKTLFATHYHELNELEQVCENVVNYNVSVTESDGKILFLRRLERGGTEHSFGIHVARLAGMPPSVVERADEVMLGLEQAREQSNSTTSLTANALSAASVEPAQQNIQLSMIQLDDPILVDIRDQIKDIDVNALTPLDALNLLHGIKKRING